MPECSPPVAFFRAGARMSASIAGPSRGTTSWRGVREVSIARRRASVSRALVRRVRAGGVSERAVGSAIVVDDMSGAPIGGVWSVELGEAGAGTVEVDVVQGGDAG